MMGEGAADWRTAGLYTQAEAACRELKQTEALEYRKLSFGHKILLRMIRSSMPNKLDLNQNHVSREAVLPLVAAAGGDFPE